MPPRPDLVAAIKTAFADVQLQDGIGIRESIVIDDYGGPREREAAAIQDKRDDWALLIDDALFHQFYAWSHAFMDNRGKYFILPALMTVGLHEAESEANDYAIAIMRKRSEIQSFMTEDQLGVTKEYLQYTLPKSVPEDYWQRKWYRQLINFTKQ